MGFRVQESTLECLEWPRLVAKLLQQCATPQARERLVGERAAATEAGKSLPNTPPSAGEANRGEPTAFALGEFEDSLAGVTERLAETREARAILEAGDAPPLHGAGDLRGALRRAERGGVLGAIQLLDIASSLATVRRAFAFVEDRAEAAPHLTDLAASAETHRDLENEIERCLDPSGEVKNGASRELAGARHEAGRLGSQLQKQLSGYLQDPDLEAGLSDRYYTIRNDRYVLPVRSDHRGKVRGIVHDASRSGTTLFIEPEAVVELNNRLKEAELTQAREIEKILRSLSTRVADRVPSLCSSLEVLAKLDLAFARGQLAIAMQAVEPEVARDHTIWLPGLRHPLLPPDEAIPNDLRIGDPYGVLVISGPNGGGKTVAMKAVGLSALMVRIGLQVPADPGARVDLVDGIEVDIGDGQDLRESLSTFSAHMLNLAEIVGRAREHSLVLLDEIGVGTDPGEGAALAQAVLEELASRGALVITTTHYNLLKEMAEVDPRFCNASVEFDPETLAPTFRLHTGAAGVSSAAAVAARMGMSERVLGRANALLDREDRQLDQMLTELASSRSALELEKAAAVHVRKESEEVRAAYRAKLERLQERRDKIFHSMREDLDRSFKEAHSQVAGVIRDLQRGGAQDSAEAARGAARARERLLEIERASVESRSRAHLTEPPGEAVNAIDWRRIQPGARVVVPGGRAGVLESLPDRRGRVRVRVGSAMLEVESGRVTQADARRPDTKQSRAPVTTHGDAEADLDLGGGSRECDLRGLRVDEALDRLIEALDDSVCERIDALLVIHGMGTGALRSAVREHLTQSPHSQSFRAGERSEGGEGVTLVKLRH